MPSLRTVFRAVVMVSVLAVVVKGWMLYGPSREQVASLGVRAIELGDSLLAQFREPAPTESDPQVAPPPFVAAPAEPVGPAAQRLPPTLTPPPAPSEVQLAAAAEPAAPALAQSATPPPLEPAGSDARLEAALAQLDQLGVGQHELRPWGTSGQLYRFCCSAAWGNSPGYSRHFEAVATEPVVAVEQVVGQIAAWRAAEQGGMR